MKNLNLEVLNAVMGPGTASHQDTVTHHGTPRVPDTVSHQGTLMDPDTATGQAVRSRHSVGSR